MIGEYVLKLKSDSISKGGKLCSWGENTLLPLMNQIGNKY